MFLHQRKSCLLLRSADSISRPKSDAEPWARQIQLLFHVVNVAYIWRSTRFNYLTMGSFLTVNVRKTLSMFTGDVMATETDQKALFLRVENNSRKEKSFDDESGRKHIPRKARSASKLAVDDVLRFLNVKVERKKPHLEFERITKRNSYSVKVINSSVDCGESSGFDSQPSLLFAW